MFSGVCHDFQSYCCLPPLSCFPPPYNDDDDNHFQINISLEKFPSLFTEQFDICKIKNYRVVHVRENILFDFIIQKCINEILYIFVSIYLFIFLIFNKYYTIIRSL